MQVSLKKKKKSVSRRDCKPQGESIYFDSFLLKMGGGDSPMLYQKLSLKREPECGV